MIHPVISDTVCPYSGGRRYYSLNDYCKEIFKEKVYRLSLSGGMSCPNRDGTLATGGCAFCSEGGSGDFAADAALRFSSRMPRRGLQPRRIVINLLLIFNPTPTPMLRSPILRSSTLRRSNRKKLLHYRLEQEAIVFHLTSLTCFHP